MKKFIIPVLLVGCFLATDASQIFAYPVDGYLLTGIRRLERLRLVLEGKLKGTQPVLGARRSISEIKLNLSQLSRDDAFVFPPVDQALQKQVDALFPNRDESYSLAVLEITAGKPMRFAKRQAEKQFPPGSVGKLAIAAGLFTELRNLFPDSEEKRRDLLQTRMVTAGKWIHTDHHEIPVYDPESKTFSSRPAKEEDMFSLYEWADHMLSASSNAAASVVWKEVMLMRHFGSNYPPTLEQERDFFENAGRDMLRDIAISAVNDPLRTIGIDAKDWRLGSFFTNAGKRFVPGEGGSVGTPMGLLGFLVALETGKVVDEWSSLEIKRLMYMTARRIRYASSPRLANAAVFFKSGSQYRCKPEPDFTCGKYMGNVENIMNSVAIVEHPEGRTYLVALMSNVLRKNSAVEHQSIATFIDRILSR